MTEQLNQFGMGARFIPENQLGTVDLGPLRQLVGQWESVILPPSSGTGTGPTPSGWNVMSVPAEKGFLFEVIPYKENLKFSAVAVEAGNSGPVINGKPFNQEITGLFYEQQIISVCDNELCNSRGFGNGKVIHAETGLFLYITNYSSGLNIARLGTVPHGNALLAMGSSDETNDPEIPFILPVSALAHNLDGSAPGGLGYNENIILDPQFKDFDQVNPNSFLESTLQQIVGSGSITQITTIPMSTRNPDATGGILNIPFIQTNVTATSMDAVFWIEQISGGTETELLQYSQTVNLVFPIGGDVTPIVWPHISVSTMKRMQQPVQQENSSKAFRSSPTPSGHTPGVPQL
ncbi:heme-binding protein [Pedobacter gandavensis]|uniref:heme-binding protein n=1 Tax=Pedobacter gandavensis TaxID=2679963 RepID=UPI00292F1B94|nr:heme-binding protein [Pedobacter gandavensis]